MTITTTQKLIRIGTSHGITLPAKGIKALGVKTGDDLEVIVRRKVPTAGDDAVTKKASDLLERYKQDFHDLANR